MINEKKLEDLSEKYLTALRIHFENGEAIGRKTAHQLGDQAVAMDLETLDLARIHEQALGTLKRSGFAPGPTDEFTNQAAIFFSLALAPIEKAHRLARDHDAELRSLTASLVERTEEVEASQMKLQQGIALRKAAETTLASSNGESRRLLKESLQLQNSLQEMAHLMLTAQEEERKTMSLSLQNDIAQTLLGLQVRLLALKKEATVNNEDFKKEIATAQRLVEKSVTTIKQFVRELGIPHAN